MMKKSLLWIVFMTLLVFSLLSVNMIGITVAQADEHDIAVISVTLSQTSVKLGELVGITVVVENQGTSNETFDVTVYYGNTALEMKTVSNLAAGLNTSLIFTWNTTDAREEIYASAAHRKIYAIKATVSTVPGETDMEDNTLVSPDRVYVFVPHYITVIPQRTVDQTLTPGKNYTISIYTDYNGSDVWGWEFTLTYNPLVLEGVEVVNGDLITGTYAMWLAGTFDNVNGRLSLTGSGLYDPVNDELFVTSGPGTLANITFKVVGEGDSYITLGKESRLEGVNPATGDNYNIIDDIRPGLGYILHGYFRNTEQPVIHDIAVINVTPSPTIVKAGELVNITVIVENQGTVAEIFDVRVWWGYDPVIGPLHSIGTETIYNLAAGANTSVIFTWDITYVWKGNHTIVAEAKLPSDTDTGDNMLQSDETVTVVQHELIVSLEVPDFLLPGDSTLLKATLYNQGFNETDVTLFLLINGAVVNSMTIHELASFTHYALSHLWTPTVEGTYNVTAYAYKSTMIMGHPVSCILSVPPVPPIAFFTYSPSDPFLGETVTFNASASYDPDGIISSYTWDFGDGVTETSEIAEHAYVQSGTYTITLTVTDNDELTDNATATITVVLNATVNLSPETLNSNSNGKWITYRIELPEDCDIEDINIFTILLDGVAPAEWGEAKGNILMVKFDRQTVIEHIRNDLGITDGEVTLTITGKLYNGIPFKGSDTVRVISKGTRSYINPI